MSDHVPDCNEPLCAGCTLADGFDGVPLNGGDHSEVDMGIQWATAEDKAEQERAARDGIDLGQNDDGPLNDDEANTPAIKARAHELIDQGYPLDEALRMARLEPQAPTYDRDGWITIPGLVIAGTAGATDLWAIIPTARETHMPWYCSLCMASRCTAWTPEGGGRCCWCGVFLAMP